jgi:hypothetical protein
MEALLTEYLRYLLESIKSDITIFNNWWMWIPALIPAACFFALILLKYALLTCPIWLPIRMAINWPKGVLYNSVKKYKKRKKKENKEAKSDAGK